MLISDNNTRWNSVYKSIIRAIQLQAKISVFSETHRKEMSQFSLTQEDWDVLKWLAQGLEVFWTQTQRLQGKAKFGHHGAIWEALPAMEYLLAHRERLKARTPQSEPRLWECVNNAWSKMTKYYTLTDKSHQIYATATFLDPTQRRDFFDNSWVGKLQPWVVVMLNNCRGVGNEITPIWPRIRRRRRRRRRKRRETPLKSGYTARKRRILLPTNSAGILLPALLCPPLRDLIL
jgi:hypothetical protein